jgi:predicted O-methyltransferase YrrM
MQTLAEYLKEHGQTYTEGNMQDYPKQVETIRKLVSDNNTKSVLEIGFNAGHSCEVFLTSSPDVTVTSFDINQHGCTAYGVRYFTENYPGRLEFIPGNSTTTVPAYPDKKFDLIFVDGGHDYSTALQDLHNCRRFAHPGTIVIMDDTVSTFDKFQHWNDGPVRAWGDIREDRLVKELFSEDYDVGRGMSIGKYVFH